MVLFVYACLAFFLLIRWLHRESSGSSRCHELASGAFNLTNTQMKFSNALPKRTNFNALDCM